MSHRPLPIFALPIVSFPGAPEFLHIFEPRYRQMLADCEATDRRFGISWVDGPPRGDGSLHPGAVGCQVVVRSVRRHPDGRSDILTVGEARYALREPTATDREYPMWEVESYRDLPDSEGPAPELTDRVRRRFAELHALARRAEGEGGPPAELPDDPSDLSFLVAASLRVDPVIKQGVLELRSAAERLVRVDTLLSQALALAEERVEFARVARRNGKRRAAGTAQRGPA